MSELTQSEFDYHADDQHEADQAVAATVRRQLEDLPFEQRFAIRWFYGIGGMCLGLEDIADRLHIDKSQVWERICNGMAEIGFGLVESVAA